MKTCINVFLRFNLATTDGQVVGLGRLVAWVVNELPHIGDRIMPCTGDSDINVVLERYDITVRNVCRNLGDEYTQSFLCDVAFATWSPHSGSPLLEACSSADVISDWQYLEGSLEKSWSEARQTGSAITDLNIAKQV